mmetsp:Transcript_18710/g.20342  ORF Transcript_18710/g.20342 Transcript_18710/m.20342 type:complete len:219 (-) Transcript_18710:845-1501(-)
MGPGIVASMLLVGRWRCALGLYGSGDVEGFASSDWISLLSSASNSWSRVNDCSTLFCLNRCSVLPKGPDLTLGLGNVSARPTLGLYVVAGGTSLSYCSSLNLLSVETKAMCCAQSEREAIFFCFKILIFSWSKSDVIGLYFPGGTVMRKERCCVSWKRGPDVLKFWIWAGLAGACMAGGSSYWPGPGSYFLRSTSLRKASLVVRDSKDDVCLFFDALR